MLLKPVSFCLVMILMAGTGPARAEPTAIVQPSPTIDAQNRALAVLDKAAAAFGGADALLAMDAIRITAKGLTSVRYQSRRVRAEPGDARQETDVFLDLKDRRLTFYYMDDLGGLLRRSLTLTGRGEPRIYNLHARTVRPFSSPPSFDRELAVHSRRAPHLLLRHALENPLQLRVLGHAMFEGRMHDIISFAMSDGVQVSLFVDRDNGTISKFDTLYFDMLTGTEAAETIFDAYTGEGLSRYPQMVRNLEGGTVTFSAELAVTVGSEAIDPWSQFEPNGFLPVGASQPARERAEELAKGVYVLHAVSDPQHNALAVEFDSYVAVVDAPHSSEGGERLIRRIESLIPGKPIRFVALSHHHDDHMAGLRSFVASGARVITTPGNREIVERLAAARRSDRLGGAPEPVMIDLVQNKRRILSDGNRTLELIDIGPNPHADEILVAYLPKDGILYQSDLFQIPSNESPLGPVPESFAAFSRAIDNLELQFDVIASGHGRTATAGEFRARNSADRSSE